MLVGIVLLQMIIVCGQNKSFNINSKRTVNQTVTSNDNLISKFKNAIQHRELYLNSSLQSPEFLSLSDTIQLDLFLKKNYTAVIERIEIDVNNTFTISARILNSNYAYCIISTFNGKSFITASGLGRERLQDSGCWKKNRYSSCRAVRRPTMWHF